MTKGSRRYRKEHGDLCLLLCCVSPQCLLFADPNKEHQVKQKCGSEAQPQHHRAMERWVQRQPTIANSLIADTHIAEGGAVVEVRFQGNWISASGKEPSCQFRRHKRCWFDPWDRKISWRRAWQPTPVFLPGEVHEQEKPGKLQSIGLQAVGHH